MRRMAGSVAVDAIDYEIVRLSEGGEPAEPGRFVDAYSSDGPVWRLVAGYLMVAAADHAGSPPRELAVFSHGRAVARVRLDDERVDILSDRAFIADGPSVRGHGIALVPAPSTEWRIADGGGVIEIARDRPWSVTVVHGPADLKVDNRLSLLASLDRVGGRHG